MSQNERFFFEDLFLCLKNENTLVLGDVHMGYEEALNKQGVLIPRSQYPLTAKRLQNFFEDKKFEKIIINGDLKHEFGSISETEWRHTLRTIDFLATKCNNLILVKGNHDQILGPIAGKRNIKVVDFLFEDDILITHGHYVPDIAFNDEIKYIVIGHEHPAVTLVDYPRNEKFKCFLKGSWKNKELLVIPSFNTVNEGSDVLKEKLLSPFLSRIDNYRVYVVGEDVLDFGTIRELKMFNSQT
ncbi:MAG: metallophosphoesterase [Candidatus Nanoarchaeia archaeon]